jgi:hypothetical protein
MTEANVRALAVSYHALLEAIDKLDQGGANTWAFILEKAQRTTGVYLIQQQTVEFWANWVKL